LHPEQAKACKAIPVPLNAEAVSLVRKQLAMLATTTPTVQNIVGGVHVSTKN